MHLNNKTFSPPSCRRMPKYLQALRKHQGAPGPLKGCSQPETIILVQKSCEKCGCSKKENNKEPFCSRLPVHISNLNTSQVKRIAKGVTIETMFAGLRVGLATRGRVASARCGWRPSCSAAGPLARSPCLEANDMTLEVCFERWQRCQHCGEGVCAIYFHV